MKQYSISISIPFVLSFFLGAILLSGAAADAQVQNTTNISGDQGSVTITTSTTTSQALGTRRDGVFDCSAGEYGMSAGVRSAIGGVYVPVNDAAVTLNTGILIYKECVLDIITYTMKEAATTEVATAFIHQITTGDDGNPQFVANLEKNDAQIAVRVVSENIKEYNTAGMCEPYKRDVKVAVLKSYIAESRNPSSSFTCTLPDEARARECSESGWCGWDTYFAFATNPTNNELWAFEAKRQQQNVQIAQELEYERRRLEASRNIKDIQECIEIPTGTGEMRVECNTLTPGFVLADMLSYVTQSGFRQLENADEVGQTISPLFASMGNQLLSNVRGLIGLSESQGGNPSYLNQLRRDANSRVRGAAVNAALQILAATLDTEVKYHSARQAARTFLDQASGQLRSAEGQCWELVIKAVDAKAKEGECISTTTDPTTGEETCTSRQEIQYTVATSTQQSVSAISKTITPLVGVLDDQISAAVKAVDQLRRLVEDVTNTSSVTAQRSALQILDSLVANRQIHDSFDLKQAEQQREDVKNTIGAYVEDTIEEWTTGSGWCNVANPSVVEFWLNEWKN